MDITTAEARALESLCKLLESDDEKVILKAATEILRRITATQRLAARIATVPPSPVPDGRGQPSASRTAGEGAHPRGDTPDVPLTFRSPGRKVSAPTHSPTGATGDPRFAGASTPTHSPRVSLTDTA